MDDGVPDESENMLQSPACDVCSARVMSNNSLFAHTSAMHDVLAYRPQRTIQVASRARPP